MFVSSKKLVAGDAFIFLRQVQYSPEYYVLLLLLFITKLLYFFFNVLLVFSRGENGELRVGVRRLMRQPSNMPSSVISSHSMHLGVLATASHAISTGTLFSVFYKPRSMSSSFFGLERQMKFLYCLLCILYILVFGAMFLRPDILYLRVLALVDCWIELSFVLLRHFKYLMQVSIRKRRKWYEVFMTQVLYFSRFLVYSPAFPFCQLILSRIF